MRSIKDHTLLIPTYNRPEQLKRLLASLHRQGLHSTVLVIDSSFTENHGAIDEIISSSDLDIELLRVDPKVQPFDKFYLGADSIKTKYCSMCADDDFVMVNSFQKIIEYLEANDDYVAAHGWYFTFYETHHVGITSVVYKGDSYDETDAVKRLYCLCERYEAITYAVYHTEIMCDALKAVRELPSILFKEFGAGACSMLEGKVARLPVFYYGRSLGASEGYSDWHPIEILGTQPDRLFNTYVPYRKILAGRLEAKSSLSAEKLELLVDLAHLRYLCDYMNKPVIDYMFYQALSNSTKEDMMAGVWQVLASSAGIPGNQRKSAKIFRRCKNLFGGGKSLGHKARGFLEKVKKKPVKATTTSGKQREYVLYEQFSSTLSEELSKNEVVDCLLTAFNTYD